MNANYRPRRNDNVSAMQYDRREELYMAGLNAPSKRETLNIRIKPEERGLIDRAARARGKNRTDFILDAARSAAEEALLDQLIITVSRDKFAAFRERLARPPHPNERLKKTMRAPSPWSDE
jgi:uncharacterized protein (DUF1778 family)